MTRIKSFLYSHRVFFGLFAFLLAYEGVIGGNLSRWRVKDDFLTFYAVDYRLGFCSRFLPGAVYRLFFDEVRPGLIAAVSVVLLVLFIAGLCALLERAVLRAPAADRPLCLFFAVLLVTGPASFSLFVVWLGVIDVYWVYLCLLFFFCLARRGLYPLLPLFFVLAVLVHFGAMLCYVPMMALALLYKLSVAEEKKDRAILRSVLCVGVAAATALTLFFMAFERRTLVYSMPEFDAVLLSRGAKYTYYYDFNLYKSYSQAVGDSAEAYVYADGGFFSTLLRTVITQIRTTLILRLKGDPNADYLLAVLLFCLPAALVVSVFISRFIASRRERCFLKKAVYLLTPLCFAAGFVASFLFSSDTFRWLTHTFVPLLGLFLYVAYHEGASFWDTVRRRLQSVPVPALAVYLAVYAAVAPAA